MSGHNPPLRFVLNVALVVCGVLSTSCHKGPTDPSDNVNETFIGTIAVGVGNKGEHMFTMSNSGELSMTLASLTPTLPAAKYAIFALGVNNGGTCTYDGSVENDFAIAGANFSLPAQKGAFCVVVVDKGDFTVPESYQIKVSHP